MRFVNPKSRERYVAAHAALRILIEAYFGLASYRQAFSTTPLGKPQLAGYPDIQCSLSYSGDHALLGVAPGAEIGLDIEQIRTITDAEDLASVYFTEREKSFLQANSPDSPAFHRDFLRIWTRKEACLKAVGQGLNGFNTIECAPGEMTTPVRIGQSQVHAGAIAMRNYAASWARATPLISF
ncbi:MAG: 4'-phosphopantetheinyl transferase superfamily protein [Sphingomonas sp.]|uniref:4'-phosphopantetheinyl transferase family protein n=1 Tax=Sphingomonas sp. TaxID=28214 RepID=UPI001B19B790|nr:4'-phosphopantetheinyl transferase superfamily protein [Sphingomonas sp.]MBO9623882.1 4'-phosphopantetheinyl transferase superfamily protein [Sphingomonas sp.]